MLYGGWQVLIDIISDVPDTALILRKHSAASNQFSCLLFNELEAFNHRDQLAFAFVRDKITPKININMFEVEVFEKIAIEYRHSLKKGQAYVGPNVKWATQSLFGYEGFGKCEDYVMKMFGKNYIIDWFFIFIFCYSYCALEKILAREFDLAV